MKVTQLLEGGARKAVRAVRERSGDSTSGPQAHYARNLDGSHLWLALRHDDGEPALRVPDSADLVDPGSDLPPDTDRGTEIRSVRWPLEAVVPLTDGAVVDVVVRSPSGGVAPVLAPPPHLDSPARNPTTPDGRWRFVLDGRPGEPLRVRRAALAPASRLLRISMADETVTLLCEAGGAADAGLFLLSEADGTTTALPSTRTAVGLESSFGLRDLPAASGGYRICVGDAAEHLPVMRLNADLQIHEPTTVLLPALNDESGDRVAARMRFAPGGVLWLHRLAEAGPDDA